MHALYVLVPIGVVFWALVGAAWLLDRLWPESRQSDGVYDWEVHGECTNQSHPRVLP